MSKEHPPSTRTVTFRTVDGTEHRGFFLKDANKYVRGVNRWKDRNVGKWYEDSEVTEWKGLDE